MDGWMDDGVIDAVDETWMDGWTDKGWMQGWIFDGETDGV